MKSRQCWFITRSNDDVIPNKYIMISPTIHPITQPPPVSQCSLPAPASAQGQHHETLNRQNGGSAGIKI